MGHLLAAIQIRQHKTLVHQSQEEMIPCCLVCCPRYHPPHRTDQTHLQPLSNHVDCYKAAGMKADVASGQIGDQSVVAVGRESELRGLFVVAFLPQWRVSSVCCSLSGGLVLFVAPSVEG